MKNAMLKNAFAEMKKTKSRFLSIFGIIAIGTGFFAGLLQSAPAMKISSDHYYDRTSLSDIRLVSTYGFDDNDIDALKKGLPDIDIYPGYFTDAYVNTDSGEKKVARVYSLDKTGENNPYSSLQIVDGRLPKEENECVIDSGKLLAHYKVGDKLALCGDEDTDIDGTLSVKEFTIVGKFASPMYISDVERGNTTIGSGSVYMICYIPESCFKTEVYTQVMINSDELKQYNCYSDKYEDARDALEKKIQKIADVREEERFDEIAGDAKKELDDGQKELDKKKSEAYAEIEKNEKKLSDAKKQLDEAKPQLESGKKTLDDSYIQLVTAKIQLENADSQLKSSKAQLDDANSKILSQQTLINTSRDTLESSYKNGNITKEAYDSGVKLLDSSQAELDKQKKQYESGLEQYNDGLKQYNDGKLQYEIGYAKYEDGKKQYDDGYSQYTSGLAQYESAKAQYDAGKAQYDAGYAQYVSGKAKYDSGKAEYDKNYADYEKGLKEYNEGKTALETAKTDADKQFADAQKKIDDGREKLEKTSRPEWYLFTRDDNPGYSEYGQNSERIGNIAMVFPLFFVMVAALVCLTTMTRMVEEERTQIGTLKALGYKNGAIIFKYLLYALTAATAGAVSGMLVGMKIFPAIIITAYGMMYVIPDILLPYDYILMMCTTGVAVLLTAVTVYFSCGGILHDCPAALMRPKTPKSGKKILLERIGFIWNRLSFSYKVTMRNIFRYKRRMLMTIVGIAGCTALVLTGFGVYDSVNDILQKQFGEISNYTGITAYDNTVTDEQTAKIEKMLERYDCEGNRIYQKQITVYNGKKNTEAYIFGGADNETIAQFVTVKDRRTGEQYKVTDDGVIINEKLATLLGGVQKGDTITLALADTKRVTATVTEICENYAHHYVYITEKLYKELSGEEGLPYNCFFFNSEDGDDMTEGDRDELAQELMKIDGVMGVSFKTSVAGTFSSMLNSLLFVIVVLIVSAGALAFIVLYNLTNININERIREIASLKVLGFYDKEVSMYVFRETVILTLIGTLTGMVFGRFLVDFVVKTAEIDMVMFGRTVHPMSFVFSGLITICFAVIVMLFMHRRLMKVNMVEALKSVE